MNPVYMGWLASVLLVPHIRWLMMGVLGGIPFPWHSNSAGRDVQVGGLGIARGSAQHKGGEPGRGVSGLSKLTRLDLAVQVDSGGAWGSIP